MVGASPDQISQLEGVSLVGETGNVLATYEKEDTRFQDAFLIQTARGQNSTVPLPSTPFYLRLQGLDSSGNRFWRMLTDLITPASTQVILKILILIVNTTTTTILKYHYYHHTSRSMSLPASQRKLLLASS